MVMTNFEIALLTFLQDAQNEFNSEKEVEYFIKKHSPHLVMEAFKEVEPRIVRLALDTKHEEFPDGTSVYRTKNLITDDLEERGIIHKDKVKCILING